MSKKYGLSSTKPKTCTIAISPTFKYSNMVFLKTIELDHLYHNFVTRFICYGDSVAMHDYMVHLNVITWRSSANSDKIGEEVVPKLIPYL
jgi:hypothetical protein